MCKKRLYLSAVALAIVSALVLGGCGSAKKETASKADMAIKSEQKSANIAQGSQNGGIAEGSTSNANIKDKNSSTAATKDQASNSTSAALAQRKVIKSGDLSMETLKFDETVDKMLKYVESIGGYVENSTISGNRYGADTTVETRNANLTVKVPKDKFEGFMNGAGEFGNIVSRSIKGEDITSSYFDTEARLNSLKIQEERLIELLKKSGSLKDIFDIEQKLTDVRYQIESFTGTLKKWDNLVDYSTVNINVVEVKEITKSISTNASFGQRMNHNFTGSIGALWNFVKGTVLFFAGAIPFLVIIVPISYIGYRIYKKRNGTNKKVD